MSKIPQTKIFDASRAMDLESLINGFLKEIHASGSSIIDIKYNNIFTKKDNSNHPDIKYSAMIIYK